MMQPLLRDRFISAPTETLVQGANRHKYFKRPIIPVLQTVPPEIVMQIPEERIESAKIQYDEPRTRTQEVQTVYRDGEAQTDPYSPETILETNDIPEVLAIKNFKFGSGLPASMAEMELIEQMREKRAFENALPPTSDEACFNLRRKLMEEQEFREWGKREDDIKRLQNERLNLLQSALVEREKETEEKHAQRTEEIRLKKTENKERALAKIQRKRIKILRKMYKARKNVELKNEKRDIIEEYANFGSTVYAPITRHGLSLDKKANKYEVQPEALSSYQGLHELHTLLENKKPIVFQSKVDIDMCRHNFKKQQNRKDRAHIEALKKASEIIHMKAEEINAKKDAQQAEDRGDPSGNVRPDTPVYDFADRNKAANERSIQDKGQIAIIRLQRLLRGRASQNDMFRGKEMRLDLIQELNITAEYAQSAQPEERDLIQSYQERVIDGVTEAFQSSIISKTMDNLAKELVKLKQERRVAAMVQMAEEERRKREAGESGRRQGELVLRKREDVLYKELMSVHQGSVDSYLQNIVVNTIDATSSVQAYDEAKLKVRTINQFLDKQENKKNKPEVFIKDLVSSFLIPDVQRKNLQRQLQFEERKFLETARKTILLSVANAGSKLETEQMVDYANEKESSNKPPTGEEKK